MCVPLHRARSFKLESNDVGGLVRGALRCVVSFFLSVGRRARVKK